MITCLNPGLLALWIRYNTTRLTGDKKTANQLLLQFIQLLQKDDIQTIEKFVWEICSSVLNNQTDILPNNGMLASESGIRIQHTLFKDIILPVLTKQYLQNSALAIRWIGQFEQFFCSDKQLTKSFLQKIGLADHFFPIHFLDKSYQLEKNQQTLRLILNKLANDVAYYIHELPHHILVMPEVFDSELKIFEVYLNDAENQEIWHDVVKNWNFILDHWTIYFEHRHLYNGFKDYQDKRKIKLYK